MKLILFGLKKPPNIDGFKVKNVFNDNTVRTVDFGNFQEMNFFPLFRICKSTPAGSFTPKSKKDKTGFLA